MISLPPSTGKVKNSGAIPPFPIRFSGVNSDDCILTFTFKLHYSDTV